jgi:hypothetical protein
MYFIRIDLPNKLERRKQLEAPVADKRHVRANPLITPNRAPLSKFYD